MGHCVSWTRFPHVVFARCASGVSGMRTMGHGVFWVDVRILLPFHACMWITIREWPALCVVSPNASAVKSGSFTNLVWENTPWQCFRSSYFLCNVILDSIRFYKYLSRTISQVTFQCKWMQNKCNNLSTSIYFQLFDFTLQNKSGVQKVP